MAGRVGSPMNCPITSREKRDLGALGQKGIRDWTCNQRVKSVLYKTSSKAAFTSFKSENKHKLILYFMT